MSESRFIRELEDHLRAVPEEDRREMLYDFYEHFEFGMADGRPMEEIESELGDPAEIAKELLADYTITKAEKEKSLGNIYNAILAGLSLSFFNIIFLLGPVIGIAGVYIALCAVALVLTLAPLAFLAAPFFGGGTALNFFVSLALCGMGLLLGAGMIKLGRLFYVWILKYIRFNITAIKGERAL